MNYFICGFMGAGKTTLLNELKESEKLSKYSFIDLDAFILKDYPDFESLDLLIAHKGFSEFRNLESEAVRRLADNTNLIVALGGGTLEAGNAEKLQDWNGLWLKVDFGICLSRIRGDSGRPLAMSLDEASLKELYLKRETLYSKHNVIENAAQALDFIVD